MKNFEGIIYQGKVYVPKYSGNTCNECDLADECDAGSFSHRLCPLMGLDQCFRLSQPLTDKINRQ